MRTDWQELRACRGSVHTTGWSVALLRGDRIRRGGSLGLVLAAVSHGRVPLDNRLSEWAAGFDRSADQYFGE